MELFDLRTLIFIGGCLKLIFAILLFLQSRHTAEVRAAISVSLSSLLSGIGLIIFSCYPRPSEVINLMVLNLFVVFGDSLFLRGLWILKRKRVNWEFIIAVVVADLIQTFVFTSIYYQPGLRVAINSLVYASVGFYIFYEFINPLIKSLRVVFVFNAVVFLSYVVLMLSRAIAVINMDNVDVLASSSISIAIYLFIIVAQTLAVFSFIIILNLLLSESLKKQVQIRDRFYTILGHDLRNPIANILGYCELLKERQLDSHTAKTVEVMHSSAKQVDRLLLSILDWVHAQREGTTDIQKVDLCAFLEEEHEFYTSIGAPKGIQITFSLQEKTWVLADRNMLKTIIRNLVSNAVKFSHEGDTVSVTCKKSGNISKIFVADNGVGMPPETVYSILENINTKTTKGTKNESGSGLGLILCHEFLEKMNGKLGLKSTIGKGTIFIVSLPLGR